MKTIPLPKEFLGKGMVKDYVFTQIAANENGFLYKITSEEGQERFEVFEKKTTPILLDWNTQNYSKDTVRVRYPKAEDFGKWAWTYQYKSSAINRLNKFV